MSWIERPWLPTLCRRLTPTLICVAALLPGAGEAGATTWTYEFSGALDSAYDYNNVGDPGCHVTCATTFTGSITFDDAPESSETRAPYTGTQTRYGYSGAARSFVVDWGPYHLEWNADGYPLLMDVGEGVSYQAGDQVDFASWDSIGSDSSGRGPDALFGQVFLSFGTPADTISGTEASAATDVLNSPLVEGGLTLAACHAPPSPYAGIGYTCGDYVGEALPEVSMEGPITSFSLVVPEADLRPALALLLALALALSRRPEPEHRSEG